MSILGIPWTIALVWIIFNLPGRLRLALDPTTLKVAWASLSYPVLYLGASWVISVAHWMKRTPAVASEGVADVSQGSASGSTSAALSSARASALAFLDVHEREQQPADDEEADDGDDRPAAGARDEVDRGEVAGPEDPGELLDRPEEPEELARLVARDQAGEERPAQGLRPALHRPDQDGQDQEVARRSS